MKAEATAQLRLLDLQAVDSTLDQLAHRLKNLPEHAALTALAERRTDVAADRGRAQTEVEDLAREQRKADADVEQVKTRRVRNQERIDAGMVSDPKQLQALQHEIETLERRIRDLEDNELEVMERLEEGQGALDALTTELAAIEKEIGERTQARDDAAADITSQRAASQSERDQLAAGLPADLLALYDRLRAQQGGVGVGALRQKRCGGCQLDIGAADLVRIAAAPPDEVLRCEECNRILVRTPDSGI